MLSASATPSTIPSTSTTSASTSSRTTASARPERSLSTSRTESIHIDTHHSQPGSIYGRLLLISEVQSFLLSQAFASVACIHTVLDGALQGVTELLLGWERRLPHILEEIVEGIDLVDGFDGVCELFCFAC